MIAHSRPTLDSLDIEAVCKTVKSCNIAQGREVKAFEEETARYLDKRYALAVNSGTAALHLSLMALNIKKGDQVALPAFVCTALLNAVSYLYADPLLIDISPDSYNMDIADLKRKLSSKTRAIILPHMFGLPADIEEIVSLGIPVIEDCAQSIGSEYNNKKTGSFGVLTICSFYATKVITTGEGGMVLTNDESYFQRIKELREYDRQENYSPCFNYKMTDMEAALGRSQLAKIEGFIEKRRGIALRYMDSLKDTPCILPVTNSGKKGHIYYRFVIKVSQDTNIFISRLREKMVICERPVFHPLDYYIKGFELVKTKKAWDSAVSIPIYPSLDEKDIVKIITSIREAC